jgi:hypothetical protein
MQRKGLTPTPSVKEKTEQPEDKPPANKLVFLALSFNCNDSLYDDDDSMYD